MNRINRERIIRSPIVYNFFLRTEVIFKVLESIAAVKPPVLFLYSDGGRNNHENNIIEHNRELVYSMIDWDCDLRIRFFDENYGMQEMMEITYREVFSEFDRLIFIEEDILADESFFYFADELLEFYKHDYQIYIIGSMNFLNHYPTDSVNSYFFSESVSTWGYATWKRVYDAKYNDTDIFGDSYYSQVVKENMKFKGKLHHYNRLNYKFQIDQSIQEEESWLMGLNENILNSALAIVPSVNLASNLGDIKGAENSDDIRLLPVANRFDLSVKSLSFPIIHPKFKIVDQIYKSKVQKKYELSGIEKSVNRIERALRILYFEGFSALIKKINSSYKKHLLRKKMDK